MWHALVCSFTPDGTFTPSLLYLIHEKPLSAFYPTAGEISVIQTSVCAKNCTKLCMKHYSI